jgi:hypothetical protein
VVAEGLVVRWRGRSDSEIEKLVVKYSDLFEVYNIELK